MIPSHSRSQPIIIIIKIVVALAFFVFAWRTSRKSKSTLNRCFITSFIAWGTYTVLDNVVFIIAPINAFTFHLANVLWRFQMLMIFVYAFFYYSSAMIIRYGDNYFKEKKRVIVQIIVLLCAFIIIAIFTNVQVETSDKIQILPENLPPVGEFLVNEKFNASAAVFVIPFALFVVASIQLVKLTKDVDQDMKYRLIANMIGNILIPIGLIYFLIRSLAFDPGLTSSIVGQFIYFCSPFFIYYSQRSRKE